MELPLRQITIAISKPFEVRQLHVEQHDVGVQLAGLAERLGPVLRLADEPRTPRPAATCARSCGSSGDRRRRGLSGPLRSSWQSQGRATIRLAALRLPRAPGTRPACHRLRAALSGLRRSRARSSGGGPTVAGREARDRDRAAGAREPRARGALPRRRARALDDAASRATAARSTASRPTAARP